jgi:signal transduction histidine kinase
MNTPSTAARGKLENLTRKVYAAILVPLTLELWSKQAAQWEHFSVLADVIMVLVWIIVLAINVTAWTGRGNNVMLMIHGFTGVLSVFLLPVMTLNTFAPSDYDLPWVWWYVGLAAISMALRFGLRVSVLSYLAVLLTAWTGVITLESVGGASLGEALQGSVYVALLTIGVGGVLSLNRNWANEVDLAHTRYLASALETARVDAVEREEQRVSALVHDKVLHTFLYAATARTPEERRASVALAAEAVDSIAKIQLGSVPLGTTTPSSLFLSLRKAALRRSDRIRVSVYVAGSDPIPIEAAQAITEATLQAIENADRHSKCTDLELKLNSPAASVISVQVVDNGRGFRLDRVPRARLGIRGSIVNRMALVGGVAKIKSAPGVGTVVSLRWPN